MAMQLYLNEALIFTIKYFIEIVCCGQATIFFSSISIALFFAMIAFVFLAVWDACPPTYHR